METFSELLAICVGNSSVPGEFPAQRPVKRSFDVFFHLRMNKRLRKQSWGWWFGTLSRPLWCHRNVCGKLPGPTWFPPQRASEWNSDIFFVFSLHKPLNKQLPTIWDTIMFMWFHCNDQFSHSYTTFYFCLKSRQLIQWYLSRWVQVFSVC